MALKSPMFCTHCKYTSPLALYHCGVRCPICKDECGGTMTHTKDQALSTSVVQQCKCSDADKTRVLEWRTHIWTLETVIRSLMTQYKCNAQDPRVAQFVKQRMDLLLKKAPLPAEIAITGSSGSIPLSLPTASEKETVEAFVADGHEIIVKIRKLPEPVPEPVPEDEDEEDLGEQILWPGNERHELLV